MVLERGREVGHDSGGEVHSQAISRKPDAGAGVVGHDAAGRRTGEVGVTPPDGQLEFVAAVGGRDVDAEVVERFHAGASGVPNHLPVREVDEDVDTEAQARVIHTG